MKKKFYAATVSTFTADNHPDVDSMAAIADRVVSRGGDGLFILGTMGEWNQLSAAESEAMISGVSAALVGRGELLAGISGTGLDLTLQNLERASRYECAAYVVVLPPVRMSQLPPVVNPSMCMVAVDSLRTNTTPYAQVYAVFKGSVFGAPAARHSGRMNLNYVDGHVSSLTPAEYFAQLRSNPADYDNNQGAVVRFYYDTNDPIIGWTL